MKKIRNVIRCDISTDARYRYVLEVRIAPEVTGAKKLVVLQKNPSTADEYTTDATVRRVENWAREKGFTIVSYLNLFAFRATDPEELNNYRYDEIVGEKNNYVITNELNLSDTVIIGWGNPSNIKKAYYNKRSREVHQLVMKSCGQIRVVGDLTKDGYPRHGLLWRDQWSVSRIEDCNVFAYMKSSS
ncbi:hypothetical protein JCM9140_320 [Halalkalibacter wakoensis JCM 9140]|uniref:DUF1643 domain-containing protein n=1 Tax=Halalkalibacter wakoensis JCM 9140 TaxID=1236970 RepID=W4PXJ2_9BACI|nr:DUF1643 domain-containing protein [Halalkalibacter wakoensis]GAE24400.1 hypothetical protein JCM9140_320 [Halalkalibacter wakoensis JCM 9140]